MRNVPLWSVHSSESDRPYVWYAISYRGDNVIESLGTAPKTPVLTGFTLQETDDTGKAQHEAATTVNFFRTHGFFLASQPHSIKEDEPPALRDVIRAVVIRIRSTPLTIGECATRKPRRSFCVYDGLPAATAKNVKPLTSDMFCGKWREQDSGGCDFR